VIATVNEEYKVNLLKQAQAARARADWSLLIQCLQQLILGEEEKNRTPSSPDQLLELAIEVLLFGDFQERWDIAKIFPKLGTGAIAPLIDILEDEDAEAELRWFAGRLLGEFSHPEVIAAVVEVLKTTQSEELSSMASAALGNIGSPAVAALTELLTQENTRLLAVRALSQIRRQETIAPLLSVVQDPEVAVRAAAIEALSSFHDPQIPPIFLSALDDIAAPVRREAVIGLSFRSDLREELALVNRLSPRLYDFNLEVCCACAIALGRLGTDAAATALYQVLSPHTPLNLQIEIVRALGWLATATSLEYLGSCLNQQLSAELLQEIVTVLGRVEAPTLASFATQMLLDLLQSAHLVTQEPRVKQAIALSLGQLGDMRAIEPLIQLLAAPDLGIRLHAITALKQLAPEMAQQQLEQLAAKAALAPALRQGVAIALAEWSPKEGVAPVASLEVPSREHCTGGSAMSERKFPPIGTSGIEGVGVS